MEDEDLTEDEQRMVRDLIEVSRTTYGHGVAEMLVKSAREDDEEFNDDG